MKRLLEIRADDVLQSCMFSQFQKRALWKKTFFKYFKEADQVFKKYNYPCILAICAEGIDKEPEWVDYIKENIARYKIELHGNFHSNYRFMGRVVGKRELRAALNKIEKTFKFRPTTWYLPWGRKGAPDWGEEVCKELGIKYDLPIRKLDARFWLRGYKEGVPPFFHINFHFWSKEQVKNIEKVLKILTGS